MNSIDPNENHHLTCCIECEQARATLQKHGISPENPVSMYNNLYEFRLTEDPMTDESTTDPRLRILECVKDAGESYTGVASDGVKAIADGKVDDEKWSGFLILVAQISTALLLVLDEEANRLADAELEATEADDTNESSDVESEE